jgi:hypothetical protein
MGDPVPPVTAGTGKKPGTLCVTVREFRSTFTACPRWFTEGLLSFPALFKRFPALFRSFPEFFK